MIRQILKPPRIPSVHSRDTMTTKTILPLCPLLPPNPWAQLLSDFHHILDGHVTSHPTVRHPVVHVSKKSIKHCHIIVRHLRDRVVKTRKLRKTLYQFDPELLQNERAKEEKQKAGANYNDIPYVDAQDPDSSIGNNHVMEEVAPPHEEAANAPPDDDEANFRRGNPNIPRDVANKLEESLSVSEEDLNMVHSLGDKALDLFTANMQGGGGG
eukprot:172899_1